jgi:CPW-WPC domain-containing protein
LTQVIRAVNAKAAAAQASATRRSQGSSTDLAGVSENCPSSYATETCPKGWTNRRGYCVAGSSYQGNCPYGIYLGGANAAQKQAFASKCGVTFCR